MRRYRSAFLVVMFAATALLSAHDKKKHARTDSIHAVGTTTASDTMAVAVTSARHDVVTQKSFEVEWPHDLVEHLHNKLVHFPVAFVAAGFLFSVLSFRRTEFETAVRWLAVLAGVVAVAAYFTGNTQASAFISTEKDWVITGHGTLGATTALGIGLWILFLFLNPLKRFAWVIATALMLLILATAFYGGILAHA